jgi:beta-lactamase class A
MPPRRSLLFLLCAAQAAIPLETEWREVAAEANGQVGAAALLIETAEIAGLQADGHFPMQSVYKLPIAMAVLELVDQGRLLLEQQVHVAQSDLVPLGMRSPLRDRYPKGDVDIALKELLRLAVSESDGTASDVLLRLAGGAARATACVQELGITEMVIATSEKEMAQAHDVQYRNWSTPRGAVALLRLLQQGKGVSSRSQKLLFGWMTETATGPHRIKGLLPAGTTVAHKTGTSGTHDGRTAATDDIGIVTLPDGRHLAIAVFVRDSTAAESVREALIARIALSAWQRWSH